MAKKGPKIDLSSLTSDERLYLSAKDAYYAGNSFMSDEDFDMLEDKLREQDSFVVEVVGSTKKKKNMLPHPTSMGSLQRIKFENGYVPYKEFLNWSKDKNGPYIFEPKLDGNAINCVYVDGKLDRALSRGDGSEGQDYKDKLNVPKTVKGFTGEIRGEAVIDIELFNLKWKKSDDEENPEKKYKNARNFVAGILNSDFNKSEQEKYDSIDFVAFEIVDFEKSTKDQLIKWGFNVHDMFVASDIISENHLIKVHDDFVKYRKNCKYQLDGIVCKTEERFRKELGRTSHHPNWALAIKFEAENVKTRVIGIDFTLGKTGQLTPTAVLEPVELMGSTVQRATLYNASWMMEKRCYPGAVVSLVKSGDIIPKIVDIIEPSKESYELPTKWEGLPVRMTDVHLVLKNFEETDQYKSIRLYNSIFALGLKGIGPATAEQLHRAGMDITSLLSENPEGLRCKLLESGEFKQGRELEILIENMFDLKSVELWQCINCLQFKNCGRTASKQLANWMTGTKHSFSGLEKAVIESFVNSEEKQGSVWNLVKILKDNNVEVVMPNDESGLISFEMTGDPPGMTKSEYKRIVEAGNKAKHTSLTKDTHYLVTNSLGSTTGKMSKAEKNGYTKIVTYDDFLEIVKNL